MLSLLALLALLFAAETLAYHGFDSPCSSIISSTQFTSIINAGYGDGFVGQYFNGSKVTNAYTLTGIYAGVNTNGINSIKNAKTKITTRRDAYHIPLYAPSVTNISYPLVSGLVSNVYAQARKPIDYLNLYAGTGAIGMTWLVVLQDAGSGWSANQTANQLWISEFLSYFPTPLGPLIGILTKLTDFQAIVGPYYMGYMSDGTTMPWLWWSDCNTGYQNYTNYVGFNYWQSPQMHRYQCSVSAIGGVSGVSGNYDFF